MNTLFGQRMYTPSGDMQDEEPLLIQDQRLILVLPYLMLILFVLLEFFEEQQQKLVSETSFELFSLILDVSLDVVCGFGWIVC